MNGNMSKILQIKVDFKFMYSTSGILKGMLRSSTHKNKNKKKKKNKTKQLLMLKSLMKNFTKIKKSLHACIQNF